MGRSLHLDCNTETKPSSLFAGVDSPECSKVDRAWYMIACSLLYTATLPVLPEQAEGRVT